MSRAMSIPHLFKQERSQYLNDCREIAYRLCSELGSATIDDVRAANPLPQHIKPSVFTSVFTRNHYEPIGYERSKRAACGFRPIVRWRLK